METNPARDGCKGPAVETETQLEENAATNLDDAENDIERENAKLIEKARRNIQPKVQAKLQIRLRNGELSVDAANDLEEQLVRELEAELEEDFEEKTRRAFSNMKEISGVF